MKNYIVTAINEDTLVSVAAQELRRYLYVYWVLDLRILYMKYPKKENA